MAGSTLVVPSAPPPGTDPAGIAECAAAMADGMRLAEARQALVLDPLRGAELRPAESTQQPYLAPDPGDGRGGVT